jgi:hypothetical protein
MLPVLTPLSLTAVKPQVRNRSIYTCETDMRVFGLDANALHPNNRLSDYCPESCTNCFGAGPGGLSFRIPQDEPHRLHV